MTLKPTKMLWISLLSIGLVSAILPTEAAEKGAIGLVEDGNVHRYRMLRGDSTKKPLPQLEPKPKPGDTNISNETLVDELSEESVDVEVEKFYTSNLATTLLAEATPVGLPYFTFTIATDSDTDEIDTSELSSLLSDYLLQQLQEKLPESLLVQVDLVVDYKYKPEKKEVDGVGFEVDKADSVHIFTATGGVHAHISTEVPTQNQIFAKARDSMSTADAESEILSLLKESKEASLREAKTFSVSEVKPREANYLLQDSHSISRGMDVFIGMTAVLILLTGAYVARDKAIAMSDNQEPQDSFDDDKSVVSQKKNDDDDDDAETLPPTPPTTPSPTASSRKTSSQLIRLSDFNIFDELSHLGGDDTTMGDDTAQQQPYTHSILRSSAGQPMPEDASTAVSAIALSDFNILDELMCMGNESKTEQKSRHVKFDDETNTTSGDTSFPRIFDPCGPLEVADGVKINKADMQSANAESTKSNSPGFFDCGVDMVEDVDSTTYDYDDYDDSTSYYSDDDSQLTY